MSAIEFSADPCLVAGSLVAAQFGERGYYIRREFVQHPKVGRWLRKHGNPSYNIVTYGEFEQLERDALRV